MCGYVVVLLLLLFSQDEKRGYDKASQSYYSALERHLSTSSKKKEMALQEVRAVYIEFLVSKVASLL